MNSPNLESRHPAAATVDPAPKRILIIDDEAGFTRVLRLNLDRTGRYISHAENDPDQALTTALQFRPHLVLMDVMMPHTDGGDLARSFQEDPQLGRVPIVFLTAAVRRSEVERNNGHFGGYRFLAKPVEMPELLEFLDNQFDDQR